MYNGHDSLTSRHKITSNGLTSVNQSMKDRFNINNNLIDRAITTAILITALDNDIDASILSQISTKHFIVLFILSIIKKMKNDAQLQINPF